MLSLFPKNDNTDTSKKILFANSLVYMRVGPKVREIVLHRKIREVGLVFKSLPPPRPSFAVLRSGCCNDMSFISRYLTYDEVSDVADNRVLLANKSLTLRRMH